MAIKIVLSNLVKFRVKGVINDEKGNQQPVDFSLTCERLPTEEFTALFNEGGKVSAGFAKITKDWGDVQDAEGKPVPYSAEALEQLFRVSGVAHLSYVAYINESGVKAKN